MAINSRKGPTLRGLSEVVTPLHLQCPLYLYSLFLINSFLSAILCLEILFQLTLRLPQQELYKCVTLVATEASGIVFLTVQAKVKLLPQERHKKYGT